MVASLGVAVARADEPPAEETPAHARVYSGYELGENTPVKPGKEEYRDSEKYQLVKRNFDDPQSLRGFMAALNRIRRENPALLQYRNLAFHEAENDRVVFYSKQHGDNLVLVAVSIDPYAPQQSVLALPLQRIGLRADEPCQVEELLTGTRALWEGPTTTVRLTPEEPVAIWRVTRFRKSEENFDYFY